MAKFVPDITTNRWVLIAENRSKRPSDVKIQATGPVNKLCIFCPGFEKIPGEELYRIGTGQPYEPGWKVRVIKNKYPITDFHEVIIHSPDDTHDLDTLPSAQVGLILEAYRARFNANRENGHVIIFNNVGEAAGASIRHPHSQLVVVPKQINIDTLKQEPIGKDFGETSDEVLADLALVLQDAIRRLLFHLTVRNPAHLHPGLPMISFKGEPAYNYYIDHNRDWYIRIIPRLVHRAGFELGTGLSVNPVDPAAAAAILSEAPDPQDK
ncbi:hypothetical protein HY024_01715 [Candidatus Curtissbacteria bacterium]|nr:hypothetical protein [Candidatus Curtissbacteria bacterium]